MKGVNTSPTTVGVFIGNYEEAYPRELRAGLFEAALQYNVRLIFFLGKTLCSPDQWQQNITYELAGSCRLDGLVIATGAISYFCPPRVMEEFCHSFKQLPKVGIGAKFKGIPTIVAENKLGMKDLVTHLVKDHGYRRIAFIRGPEGGQEAEERFAGYREILSEYGIPERSEWVLPGSFTFHSGISAVNILLDERKLSDVEVLVGCNDASIAGTVYELERRGFTIPNDFKVTGFDDIEKLEYQSVPLTTVSQNVYQQGFSAVEMLLALMNGEDVPEILRIPSRLIIRESCGCLPGDGFVSVYNVFPVRKGKKCPEQVEGIREERFTCNEEPADQGVNLLNSLQEALEEDIRSNGVRDRMVQTVNRLLFSLPNKMRGSKKIRKLQELLWVVCRHLESRFPEGLPIYLLNIMQKAQARVDNALLREEITQHNRSEVVLDCLRRFNSHTNSIFTDLDELMNYVISEMPSLGIMNCFVSLYQSEVRGNNAEGWQVPEISRMVMAYRRGRTLPLSGEELFSSRLLVPEFLFPHDIDNPLVVMALVSRDRHFGFIVFGDQFNHTMVFDMVREQVSNSIYTHLLYKELEDLSVKDELTGLYNRRGFFVKGKNFCQTAENEGKPFCVFFTDMDGLKEINDSYGHKEGDFAIQRAADALTIFFKEEAVIARLGGDEFAAIATESDLKDAEKIMETFISALDEINRRIEDKPYRVSMSMGFSRFEPNNSRTLDELLDEADQNLYAQKAAKKRRGMR